jgi:thymidylate synthase (FAD)
MSITSAKLVSVTPDAEKIMAYVARVSSPSNQQNASIEKLLRYCLNHKHWSIFEHATMTVELNTTVAIAIQILRHRAFCFQQFSQRYADVSQLSEKIPMFELRAQDTQNRQNSLDTLSPEIIQKYQDRIEKHFDDALQLYKDMLMDGVAKESARFVLPMAMPTRMYITGNCRSWIHYLDVRSNKNGHEGAQREHVWAAEEIRKIFDEQFPIVAAALNDK